MNMYAFRGFDVFEVYILWMAWHTHALKTLHSLTSSTCVKVKTSSTHIRNVGECDVFKAHSNIVQCLV